MIMQIALVCNSAFGTDGISLFVMENHRCFSHDRARFHLIYSSIHSPKIIVDGYVKEFSGCGDKAVFISKKNSQIKYAWNLFCYLKKEKINVLHVHGSSSAILIEMIAAKIAGVGKIVSHSHNTRGAHNIIHKILRPAVNWFADEKLACGELAGKWMYGKSEAFTIIPNCIDTVKYAFDEFIRTQVRNELGIDNETIVLGHVGMFTEVKNQSFLLHLLTELNKGNDKKYKLLLIGHGPLLEVVQKESKCMALSNSVMFLGNRNDVPRLMMAMDVFCLPSLYEGFPIVAVEAQASGLPTILSKNISKEVCITDLVKLLPIDEGMQRWVLDIEEMLSQRKCRNNYADEIKKAGYDIQTSASLMEEIYK